MFFVLAIFVTLLDAVAGGVIVNSKIDRIIDLSSQLVKITERIHIDDNVGLYKILLQPSHRQRLAYLDASVGGKSLDLVDNADGSYDVDLSGLSAKPLVVTSVFTKLLEPYPAEIRQNERQLVRYQGLQATLSPYLTKTITTRIKLPQGSRLESFTKASKMTAGTNKLIYGPFKDVQPNQSDPLSIHFENNTPFVSVTNLLRTVEVSPWWARGINIVNHVQVAHVGAKLKGPFSRIDYQRDPSNGISSVKTLFAELPKASKYIFYRDGIGNISTSTVKHSSTNTIVAIKPRFPLFGGWVTDFNLGYTVPIYEFLNEPVSGHNYRLSIPLADLLYENMFIEDATIRIILPAGARDIKTKEQFQLETQRDGRPVVVIKKSNVVQQQCLPLVIRYDYNKFYLAQDYMLITTILVIAASACLVRSLITII